MFQAPKLTDAGKALYYDNIGGEGITFTKIKMGKGTLSTPIATLTDLVDTVASFDAILTNNAGQYADVSGVFSNQSLSTGFYWKEIGVFAADPDHPDDRAYDILYCYQNAYDTADYIPAYTVETVEKYITVPIIVGDAANVSCIIDTSLVFATQQDLTDLQDSITDQKGAANGLATLDNSGKVPTSQLPDLSSTYVPASEKAAASGVATLNTASKVTADQASASIVSVTSNKTLALTDAGTFQNVNSSSNRTVTVPTNSSVAFPLGTEIEIFRGGSGSVTIAAASGVTIRSPGSNLSIAEQYGCAVLKKIDTNVWVLGGALG